MADLRRNQSYLQTEFADNITGSISAQNLRDFLVSSHLKNLVVKTDNYTADSDDATIILDGTTNSVQVTLPPSNDVQLGKIYLLKTINITNTCSVVPDGLETIDDSSSFTFGSANDAIEIVNDGISWRILSEYIN